ncbi:MAG: hypothetical protein JSS09_08655, partial [Verrucomicrobia bacterium]|nr:hypothetical protein [Verrucomicrobiota bacterium]
MSIELNDLAPENLRSTSDVDTKISEVDQKIQKITTSIFYRFFGFGNKNLQTHIGELKTIAYTSLPTSTDQTISAKKIQEAIAPILKSSNKTTLTAAKDLNYSLNLVKEGFSLANILDSSFATQYDQKPDYRFHLKLKGKTLDLQGAGLNELGQLKAKGAFGRVFFGKDPDTGKEIA